MECASGRLHTEVAQFGIIPSGSKVNNYCQNTDVTSPCTNLLNQQRVRDYLTETCHEKQTCELDITKIVDLNTFDSSKKCFQDASNLFI
jgi:hypothetical protein